MGQTRKMMVYKRRLKVRDSYLKGVSVTVMADEFNTSESVIRNDIKEVNNQYMKTVKNNPRILEKQAEHILKHLEQLEMVKARLWQLEETAEGSKNKIGALKAILTELDHEAKILKLIDVSKTINNYIHIDKINVLVTEVIKVMKEFVPPEKQKYAFDRLKQASNIIDVDGDIVK